MSNGSCEAIGTWWRNLPVTVSFSLRFHPSAWVARFPSRIFCSGYCFDFSTKRKLTLKRWLGSLPSRPDALDPHPSNQPQPSFRVWWLDTASWFDRDSCPWRWTRTTALRVDLARSKMLDNQSHFGGFDAPAEWILTAQVGRWPLNFSSKKSTVFWMMDSEKKGWDRCARSAILRERMGGAVWWPSRGRTSPYRWGCPHRMLISSWFSLNGLSRWAVNLHTCPFQLVFIRCAISTWNVARTLWIVKEK